MTSYVFPGQGSQMKGMGGDLFKEFSEYTKIADEILGYSIAKLCLEDPQNQLGKTEYTQPSLYTVNALMYFKKKATDNKNIHFLAGHSLGEYNALLAAEVFDFGTGLKLVKKRGELMSKANNGAMAAVVGLKKDTVESVLAKSGVKDVTVANYNSYTQLILTGQKDSIKKLESAFTSAGATMFIPLNVSGAFHSPYMADAQKEFAGFLKEFNFSNPKIPVIANVNAQPYKDGEVAANLEKQICDPVLWVPTIEYMKAQGETEIEEVGPNTVLKRMLTAIMSGK